MPEFPSASEPRPTFASIARLVPGLVSVIDSLALLGAGFLSFHYFVYYSYQTAELYYAAIVFNWLVTVALLYFGGLYRHGPLFRPELVVDRLMLAPFTAFLLLLAAAFSIKQSEPLSRLWSAALLPSCIFALLLARAASAVVLRRLANHRAFSRNLVVAGYGEQLAAFLRFLTEEKPRFINVVGLFVKDEVAGAASLSGFRVIGNFATLPVFSRANAIDDVVLAMPWSDHAAIMPMIEKLRELPLNVYLGSDLIGFRVGLRAPPNHYEALPLSEVTGKPLSGWDVIIKAVEDYAIAVLALVALAPLLVVVSMAVKLSSPGPVLFRQKRLGFNNQEFDIYKFRTMTHQPAEQGPTIQASQNDSRVTTLGRFLRRTSVDELPQLINVLNGSMSIVGPRPHAIDHNEEYSEKIRGYFARHRMKPGITGLAQVKGYRGPTESVDKMEMRVKYDVEYTENWSPTLDLKILARTIIVCIWGRNAY